MKRFSVLIFIIFSAVFLTSALNVSAVNITASQPSNGVTVATWTPPPAQMYIQVFRNGNFIDYQETSAGRWQQGPGSVDSHFKLELGDRLEIKMYNAKWVYLGKGTTHIGARLWLPLIRK